MTDYIKYSDLAYQTPEMISSTQNALLKSHLEFILRKSQFYRKHLKNIKLDEISPDTMSRLPTTSKQDISKQNSDFLTCTPEEIAEIVYSSGTSGTPIQVAYTENDLERLKYNEMQALKTCGVRKNDRVLLTCTMDRCFIAGLAYFLGCRAIGAATIRNGANTLESHLNLIKQMRPNVIIGVPSFLAKLARYAAATVSPDTLGIEKLVCIGEPLRIIRNGSLEPTPVCTRIEKEWGADAYSTYASTEMITAFCECEAKSGGHLIPELAIVEILDDNGTPVEPGQIGEVTITPFFMGAMPLLRYRTGDMAALLPEKCSCGRNSVRISGITGRKHQMLKCRGTTFYPAAIYNILDSIETISDYQLKVRHTHLSDTVSVTVAFHADTPTMPVAEIEEKLRSTLRVKIPVSLSSAAELRKTLFPPDSRKPIKLIIEGQ